MKNLKVLAVIVFAILVSVKANAQKTTLSKGEVPVEITNYITQNFKDHTVRKVTKEISYNKTAYEIKLNKKVELEFDATYKIVEIDSKLGIPTLLLPVRIVDYVQTNFPNFKIIEWKLNEQGQKVELSNDAEIQFDANGNFIK